MPERTSAEAEQKIKIVKEKAAELGLDKTDELHRLDAVWNDLKKREEEKKKYLQLLEDNIKVAQLVEDAMEKQDPQI